MYMAQAEKLNWAPATVLATSAEKLQKQIAENPEIRAVLEIAMRAREMETTRPARVIGIATDIAATPSNSQCPV
jgi:coenzyme F420-reducing hydrogenase beta subunit